MGIGIKMGAIFKEAKGVLKYIIRFLPNNGTGTIPDMVCKVGKEYTLPVSGYSRTGYLLQGWNWNSVLLSLGQKIKNLSKKNHAVVSLSAIWKAITYSIYYSPNGGTGSLSHSSHTYDIASNLKTISRLGFTRRGYTFSGWAKDSPQNAATYVDGATVQNWTAQNNGSIQLYAKWADNAWNAITNGYPQPGCYPSAWESGYSSDSGTLKYEEGLYFYGGAGHTSDENQNWGANTNNIPTKGCRYLSVTIYVNNWYQGPDANLKIWGISANGSETILRDSTESYNSINLTYITDISAYDSARVYINASDSGKSSWMNVGLREVKIYN